MHGFLFEIGQGVQHVASRVRDIVDFVQSANDNRKMFGEGFAFLNIPRSYYGILTMEMLVMGVSSRRRREDFFYFIACPCFVRNQRITCRKKRTCPS